MTYTLTCPVLGAEVWRRCPWIDPDGDIGQRCSVVRGRNVFLGYSTTELERLGVFGTGPRCRYWPDVEDRCE